jgi:hypothetical protein
MKSALLFENIDINGRTVWTERFTSDVTQYSINPEVSLRQGIYIARISSQLGVAQERFVVE